MQFFFFFFFFWGGGGGGGAVVSLVADDIVEILKYVIMGKDWKVETFHLTLPFLGIV